MVARPRLSRAGYLSGLQCERRLWLSERRADASRARGTPSVADLLARGDELRRLARQLFPGGRGVDAADFAEAAARTRALCADARVPALFGAALERAPVALRVDVLERLDGGRWRLCNVAPVARPGEPELDAAALALFAGRGSGLDVAAVEVACVDPDSVWPGGDARACLARHDVTAEAELLLEDVPSQVERLARALVASAEPDVEPSPHCRRPSPCEFRPHCLHLLPDDWIDGLPGLRGSGFHALRELGVARIRDLPDDWPLTGPQSLARAAHRAGAGLARAPELRAALAKLGPPADYLDFEAIAPVLPVYPGTRPLEPVPVAWSLHRRDVAGGALEHRDWLAPGAADPRRELAKRLLAALEGPPHPILVWSPFEADVLAGLAREYPDLAPGLGSVRARLHDLQPVVRRGVYHVAFRGSLSLKRVASALCPGFGYDDLAIADGGAAADTFLRIARAELGAAAERRARAALRAYCARDTAALASLHTALLGLAALQV